MGDYSKLSDEEINELIFKAKGWVKSPPMVIPQWQRPTKDGIETWAWEFLPNYTNDWMLAGKLLEEMRPAPALCNIRCTTAWYCSRRGNSVATIAATPQRAICEEWLKWRERTDG